MGHSVLGIPDDQLQGLGDNDTVSGVLQNFGNDVMDELRKNLQQRITTVTPKSLEQSIVFDIKFLGRKVQFQLKMNDYWEFVDLGVQGAGGVKKDGTPWIVKNSTSPFSFTTKRPPISSLAQWSNANQVNPFVVQQSVFRKGTRPTFFFSDVVDTQLITDLVSDLEKAGAKEIATSIKNNLNGTSN